MKKLNVKLSIAILLILSVLSCESLPDKTDLVNESRICDSQDVINFSFKKQKIGDFYDSIIKEIDFIPLETTGESIIGYISEIIKFDNLILISENYKNKQVLLFNDQGKFLRKLSRIGRAANEYLDPTDVAVDSSSKVIYVLDGDQGKLLSFHYDGEFIKSQKLPFDFAISFEIFNDSIFVFDCGFRNVKTNDEDKNFNVIKYDIKQEKIIDGFFQYNGRDIRYLLRAERFSSDGSTLYYWGAQLGTTAYRVAADSLVAICHISGDFERFPQNFLSLKPSEFRKSSSKAAYGKMGLFYDFENWYCTRLDFPNSAILAFKNKINGAEYWDVSSNYNKKEMILPNIQKIDNQTFCSFINPVNAGKMPIFELYLNEVEVNDNPIIVIYTLK